jgi:hypothetical protein
MARNSIPVDSIRLELINLTVPQLRQLLGKYEKSLSDADAEHFVQLVRRMADKQATAPSAEKLLRRLLDEQAAALSLTTEELVSRMADRLAAAPSPSAEALVRRLADKNQEAAPLPEFSWDTQAVAAAVATIHDVLPTMVAAWASLSPNDEITQVHAALAQLVDPWAAAEPALLKVPLGDYKPLQGEQIQIKPEREKFPWQVPAFLLATALDRMLRQPGDTKLPPFSHGSRLTLVVHRILIELGLEPPKDASAVSSQLERMRNKDEEKPGRLPLGKTDGHQLRQEAMLHQRQLLMKEQLRVGAELKKGAVDDGSPRSLLKRDRVKHRTGRSLLSTEKGSTKAQ